MLFYFSLKQEHKPICFSSCPTATLTGNFCSAPGVRACVNLMKECTKGTNEHSHNWIQVSHSQHQERRKRSLAIFYEKILRWLMKQFIHVLSFILWIPKSIYIGLKFKSFGTSGSPNQWLHKQKGGTRTHLQQLSVFLFSSQYMGHESQSNTNIFM